jgi:hypothetical protein
MEYKTSFGLYRTVTLSKDDKGHYLDFCPRLPDSMSLGIWVYSGEFAVSLKADDKNKLSISVGIPCDELPIKTIRIKRADRE